MSTCWFVESDDGAASAAVIEAGLYVLEWTLRIIVDDILRLRIVENLLVWTALTSETLLAREC